MNVQKKDAKSASAAERKLLVCWWLQWCDQKWAWLSSFFHWIIVLFTENLCKLRRCTVFLFRLYLYVSNLIYVFLCSMKSVRTLVLLCNPVIPYTLTLRSSSTCKHSGYIHFCYLCNKECQSLSGLNVTTSPPSHSYIAFDFHKECSRMRWDRLQILVDSVAETQDEYR